jgi:hypothetical protein
MRGSDCDGGGFDRGLAPTIHQSLYFYLRRARISSSNFMAEPLDRDQ